MKHLAPPAVAPGAPGWFRGLRGHRYQYALTKRRGGEFPRSRCIECGGQRRRVAIVTAGHKVISTLDLFRKAPGLPWTTDVTPCTRVVFK